MTGSQRTSSGRRGKAMYTESMLVWFSAKQLAKLTEAAIDAGKDLSAYVRDAAMTAATEHWLQVQK